MIKRFNFFEQVDRIKNNKPLIESDNVEEDLRNLKQEEEAMQKRWKNREIHIGYDGIDVEFEKALERIRSDIKELLKMEEEQNNDNS